MKVNELKKFETNSTVMDRLDRLRLKCSFCKPHKRENSTRRIPKTDKYKNKRR